MDQNENRQSKLVNSKYIESITVKKPDRLYMHQNNPNVTIYDSRSYGGMRKKSDYKLKSSLFEWKYSNTPKHRSRIIYELLYAKI